MTLKPTQHRSGLWATIPNEFHGPPTAAPAALHSQKCTAIKTITQRKRQYLKSVAERAPITVLHHAVLFELGGEGQKARKGKLHFPPTSCMTCLSSCCHSQSCIPGMCAAAHWGACLYVRPKQSRSPQDTASVPRLGFHHGLSALSHIRSALCARAHVLGFLAVSLSQPLHLPPRRDPFSE